MPVSAGCRGPFVTSHARVRKTALQPAGAAFYNADMTEQGQQHDHGHAGGHDDTHGVKHGDRHAVHLALVERLRRQAAEVRRLTSGLPEASLAAPTVPGKWSLKEIVCHLRRMEEVFADRFNRMLGEDGPAIV